MIGEPFLCLQRWDPQRLRVGLYGDGGGESLVVSWAQEVASFGWHVICFQGQEQANKAWCQRHVHVCMRVSLSPLAWDGHARNVLDYHQPITLPSAGFLSMQGWWACARWPLPVARMAWQSFLRGYSQNPHWFWGDVAVGSDGILGPWDTWQALTPMPMKVLHCLIGRAFAQAASKGISWTTQEQLMHALWGGVCDDGTALGRHVTVVRRALRRIGSQIKLVSAPRACADRLLSGPHTNSYQGLESQVVHKTKCYGLWYVGMPET